MSGKIEKRDEGVLKVWSLQKVPELVAHQGMSHCKKVEGLEKKAKVTGWSTEEMNISQAVCWWKTREK